VATRGPGERDDGRVAGGIRIAAVFIVTSAAAVSPAAAARADGTSPPPARSTPAATSHSTAPTGPGARGNTAPGAGRGPAADVPVAGSVESGEVTRLLLLLLLGLLVLVVIPIQISKGVAQRRRRASPARVPARRTHRRP
jgi:hypothetical protein